MLTVRVAMSRLGWHKSLNHAKQQPQIISIFYEQWHHHLPLHIAPATSLEPAQELHGWRGSSYCPVWFQIMSGFIAEIPRCILVIRFIKQSMSYSDQQLRDAVDAVFNQYDTDKNNSLDANEVGQLINAALNHMGAGRQVSQNQIQQFLKAVDSSGDGKIQKPELFEIFKKVLSHH